MVTRETQAEAEEYVDYMAVEKADWEAAALLAAWASIQVRSAISLRTRSGPRATVDRIERGQQPLWGTPQRVAELLEEFSSNRGVDGMVLTFVNYHDELRRWIKEVNPILEKMNLRQPGRASPRPGRDRGVLG